MRSSQADLPQPTTTTSGPGKQLDIMSGLSRVMYLQERKGLSMLQKRKTTAWMLLASLIVMSIFISCFATSATRTYADGNTVHININRPTNSTLGSVRIHASGIDGSVVTVVTVAGSKNGTNVTDPNECIAVPLQDQDTPTDLTFPLPVSLTLSKFSSADCGQSGGDSAVCNDPPYDLTQAGEAVFTLLCY